MTEAIIEKRNLIGKRITSEISISRGFKAINKRISYINHTWEVKLSSWASQTKLELLKNGQQWPSKLAKRP